MSTGQSASSPLRLMDPARGEAMMKDVLSRVSAKGAVVSLYQKIDATGIFARNDIKTVENTQQVFMDLQVNLEGRQAYGMTTRTDPEGLAKLISHTEETAK